MNCKNHPDRQAADRCASCGEEFCGDCLSEYGGKRYCAPCLKAEVAVATARLGGGGVELARMKKTLVGCSVVLISLVLAMMFVIIYPLLKPLDVARCRANLKRVYKALVAYAKENDGRFPAGNNDLRPLLAEGYLRDGKFLRCPGAEKRLDTNGGGGAFRSSDERFPPGMSYIYQGGLGLAGEEDSPRPVMWDRSAANHRGKGINILYTDGTVKFRRKGLSKIKLRRMDTDW